MPDRNAHGIGARPGARCGATVLELRAADAAGLLHRVTAALER